MTLTVAACTLGERRVKLELHGGGESSKPVKSEPFVRGREDEAAGNPRRTSCNSARQDLERGGALLETSNLPRGHMAASGLSVACLDGASIEKMFTIELEPRTRSPEASETVAPRLSTQPSRY